MTDTSQSTTTSLANWDRQPLSELEMTYQTLVMLSKGPTVPDRYYDKPNDMLAAVMYGKEIGISPMAAITNLYLVNGSVGMSAKMMSALIHRAGHVMKISEHKSGAAVKIVIECLRWHRESRQLIPVGEVSFGTADAAAAGLSDKDTYQQYPRHMLTNRAISFAARTHFGDVISGVGYTPEELDTYIDQDVDYSDVIAADVKGVTDVDV